MKPGLLPTPSMSSTSSSSSSPAPWPVQPTPHALPPSVRNQARTLACEMCWRRKLKCDRNPPCSNCVKACCFQVYSTAVKDHVFVLPTHYPSVADRYSLQTGFSCAPRTTTSEPKCRRRNDDLRKRLTRCEELLQEYANKDCADGLGSADLSSTNAVEHGDQEYNVDHTNIKTNVAVYPAVKFVKDNGVSRFMDSRLFGALIEEVHNVPPVPAAAPHANQLSCISYTSCELSLKRRI